VEQARELGDSLGKCSILRGELPAFYDALRYVAMERSASRREQAAIRSQRHSAAGYFTASAEIPAQHRCGCTFSMNGGCAAVHRAVMDGGAMKEIFVGFPRWRFMDVLGHSRLARSPNILLRKKLFCTKASTPKLGWSVRLGSARSAAARRGYVPR